MNSKVDSEYKDISIKTSENIKNALTSNWLRQLQISQSVNPIFHFNNLLGTKSKNKQLIKVNFIEGNSYTQKDRSKSDLSFHYQYFKSNKNVFCEYFQEPNSFIGEPQTIEFDLFNINFCIYCSNEFWLNNGGNV